MIAAQRRNLIVEIVRADGAASIASLAKRLDTSPVTIRRDLDHLDSLGLIARTHGGAVAGTPQPESPYTEKVTQAATEKLAIGRLAATLVHDGDVVAIGPGTTTEALALELRRRTDLTVVTNSLPVAQAFVDSRDNQVIMTGGTLRGPIRALVGEAAARTFRAVHADLAFLSGNGLDAEFGLSTPNLTVADTDRSIAASGREIVVLADHTKIGARTAIQTLPAEAIAHLVTDAGGRGTELDGLGRLGVSLHIAS